MITVVVGMVVVVLVVVLIVAIVTAAVTEQPCRLTPRKETVWGLIM